jgi:hypothetical protein
MYKDVLCVYAYKSKIKQLRKNIVGQIIQK